MSSLRPRLLRFDSAPKNSNATSPRSKLNWPSSPASLIASPWSPDAQRLCAKIETLRRTRPYTAHRLEALIDRCLQEEP